MTPYIVHLHDYELDALIAWHRDEQYKTAQREDYVSAADHKRRQEQLEKLKGTVGA
jgi:hypothetical protein